jgi:outer membrane protein OmpA-like peptidoglycan-associated protein
MRTSILVGVFGLALAVAGVTEWASRRASGALGDGSANTHTKVTNGPPPSSMVVPRPFGEPVAPAASPAVPEEKPAMATLVLDASVGGFRLNAVTLPDSMTARIDELLTGPNASDLLCGHFVIEGHTDNLGSPEVNKQIGLARAFAVRQYLGEKYGIPRDAMRIVSYGGDRPVADNTTQEGRARNRRVVITIQPMAHE